MTVINLTPHVINLHFKNAEGVTVSASYAPEAIPARVSMTQTQVDEINGFPVMKTEYGQVTGLPEPMLGVYYIVSMVVKAACPDRTDLLCPDSGRAKRDESGNIVSVPGFTV